MTEETPPLGQPGNPIKLTDPKMMRALAHPARIAILTHLALHGPATATECADVAGLSPSACSYHLRALSRYGIVEEDAESAADGRQRPWRVRVLSFSIDSTSSVPAATRIAGQLLAESLRADNEETRARYLNRQSEYPDDWQHALGDSLDVAHVTPEELTELKHQIDEVIGRYRRLDPAERPQGTLPVRLSMDIYPWFGPEETRPGEAAAT
ncbi:MAG TPA: helix-turn-helix domain-containing protein [Streptosporangiaceae bacterium]